MATKIDRKLFFRGLRESLFPKGLSQSQVDGCNLILDEWETRKLVDLRWLAYIFATVYWETARTIQPISEYGGQAYLRSKPYYPYYGRGYVQLTWEDNYRKMSNLVGIDLVSDPEKAKVPETAIDILYEGMTKGESGVGDFTHKSLEDYFSDVVEDWVNARRIINGTDKAHSIAAIGKDFLAVIKNSSIVTEEPDDEEEEISKEELEKKIKEVPLETWEKIFKYIESLY